MHQAFLPSNPGPAPDGESGPTAPRVAGFPSSEHPQGVLGDVGGWFA